MKYVIKLKSERALLVIQHSTVQLGLVAVGCVDYNGIVLLFDSDVILRKILSRSRPNTDLYTILLHLQLETASTKQSEAIKVWSAGSRSEPKRNGCVAEATNDN